MNQFKRILFVNNEISFVLKIVLNAFIMYWKDLCEKLY